MVGGLSAAKRKPPVAMCLSRWHAASISSSFNLNDGNSNRLLVQTIHRGLHNGKVLPLNACAHGPCPCTFLLTGNLLYLIIFLLFHHSGLMPHHRNAKICAEFIQLQSKTARHPMTQLTSSSRAPGRQGRRPGAAERGDPTARLQTIEPTISTIYSLGLSPLRRLPFDKTCPPAAST